MRSLLLLLLSSLCALSSLPTSVQAVADLPTIFPPAAEYETQVAVKIFSKDFTAIYYTLDGRVGTFHHVILQPKHQLMTASMVHVTNLTPGSDATTLVGRMVNNTN
jgi:hypothetical protein